MSDARNWRSDPQRPTITPAFAMGLSLWLGCAASYSGGRLQSAHACGIVGLVALVSALVAVPFAFSKARTARSSAIVASALMLGVALGFLQAQAVHDGAQSLSSSRETTVDLRVEGDSSLALSGERFEARLAGGSASPLVTVYAKAGGPFYKGETLRVTGRLSPEDHGNDERAWREGLCATVSAVSCERAEGRSPFVSFRIAAVRALGGDEATDERALLQAVACGYRRNIANSDAYADYKACGLAHLIAVSGAHLVIVMGLAAAVLGRLRASRKTVVIVSGIVALCYLSLAGMPVSAIRATVMTLLALTSYFGKRRASSLNALGIALVLMPAFDPLDAVSVSFALSCLSTSGIVLLGPLFSHWASKTPLRRAPVVRDALTLTLAASLPTQLYAASLFGVIPLAAPLANVICTPLFPALCAAGIAAALVGAFAAPLASTVLCAGTFTAGVVNSTVHVIAQIPYACVPVDVDQAPALAFSVAVCALLWFLWLDLKPRIAAAVCTAFLLASVACNMAYSMRDAIVMLDVGQGDAVLLVSRGHTLLVDTGNKDSRLLSSLGSQHVAHIDSVLVTHADDDHCGSLDALASYVDVDRVIVFEDMLENDGKSCRALVEQACKTAPELVGISYSDSFDVGAFTCEVVWPHCFRADGGNADSVCLLVGYDPEADGHANATALLTGDAESEEISCVLDERDVGRLDVLKVGHHGSAGGLEIEQAQTLAPRVALIGVGANNRYGHPADETLSMLESVGAAVYRTDLDGTIVCSFSASGMRVKTMQ